MTSSSERQIADTVRSLEGLPDPNQTVPFDKLDLSKPPVRTCPRCGGAGRVYNKDGDLVVCPTCNGTGVVPEQVDG